MRPELDCKLEDQVPLSPEKLISLFAVMVIGCTASVAICVCESVLRICEGPKGGIEARKKNGAVLTDAILAVMDEADLEDLAREIELALPNIRRRHAQKRL